MALTKRRISKLIELGDLLCAVEVDIQLFTRLEIESIVCQI